MPPLSWDGEPMNVLHYIPSVDAYSGGLGSYMQITTPELGKLVDLHVATHRTDNELPLKNCTKHYISGTGINISSYVKDEVFALINNVKPDIIHINCCWTPLSAYFAIWAREYCKTRCIHIPIIYTPHGMLEPWIIAHNYWTRKMPATIIYQRKALKCADMIHSTAESERRNLRKLGWNKNIHIIPNCVDVTNIMPKASWRKTHKILFLSRVHEKKGINFIIEAVAQLKEELHDYRISIVGPGEDRYVKQLVAMAKSHGVSDIITFEGSVFGDRKFELYKEADLFLLPTHSENFGIVVAEALACGTPVITTVGTPWKELNERHCGWCIEIGTKPLVDSLHEFLRMTETELEVMGRNGRQLVEDKYSCESIAQQFYSLYNDLTNRPLTVLHYIPRIDRGSGGLGAFMQLMSKEIGARCRLHVLTHKHSDNIPLENCTISYLSSIWPTFITKGEFCRILDKIHPDIVHVNTCWMPLSAYTVMWAKEMGYKVVLTPHGMLDKLIIKHNYWTRKMPAILSYQRKAVNKADIIHSTSEHERKVLHHIGWNRNIRVIPNGVNLDSIKMKEDDESSRTILYLGRIHPQKGLEHLIEAVVKTKKLLMAKGYSVKIVGMGEESYITKIKDMAYTFGLNDIIHFQGPRYEERKFDVFRHAALTILPSHSESFGLVVAESLACGTPVITTKGTPWSEINGHINPQTGTREGCCGWWIDTGTEPLAAAITEFLNTPDNELRQMSHNGRALIENHYSTIIVAEELIDVYNKIKDETSAQQHSNFKHKL